MVDSSQCNQDSWLNIIVKATTRTVVLFHKLTYLNYQLQCSICEGWYQNGQREGGGGKSKLTKRVPALNTDQSTTGAVLCVWMPV